MCQTVAVASGVSRRPSKRRGAVPGPPIAATTGYRRLAALAAVDLVGEEFVRSDDLLLSLRAPDGCCSAPVPCNGIR